jgi:hypothetical protein
VSRRILVVAVPARCHHPRPKKNTGGGVKKFDMMVALVCFCSCFGIAHAADPNELYADLSQVLSRKAVAPEKLNCVNRAPFGEGYACGQDEPGASFTLNTLTVDSVSQRYRNEVITTTLLFSPDHCIAYDGFEAYLLKTSDRKLVKFWRSDRTFSVDGGAAGVRDDFRFYEAKKLSIFHKSNADTGCITQIQITKRIK